MTLEVPEVSWEGEPDEMTWSSWEGCPAACGLLIFGHPDGVNHWLRSRRNAISPFVIIIVVAPPVH